MLQPVFRATSDRSMGRLRPPVQEREHTEIRGGQPRRSGSIQPSSNNQRKTTGSLVHVGCYQMVPSSEGPGIALDGNG